MAANEREGWPPLHQRIIYEDNHLIAVNKLPGELTQGDETGDLALPDLLKEFVRVRDAKPGNVFIGVIHRLDRPVGGVVIFGKTSKGLARMNTAFSSRQTQKTYLALVEGNVDNLKSTLLHYLTKDSTTNKARAHGKEVPNSKHAELSYEVMERGERYTLLKVTPLTGRAHQIRVQLSKIGHPIRGDVKYGARRGNPDQSICLHAKALTFIHPVSHQPVHIEAHILAIEPWAGFASQ